MHAKLTLALASVLLFTNILSVTAQTGETLQVQPFDKVEVSGKFEIEFRQCDRESVTLISGKTDPEKIVTEVRGRTLDLRIKRDLPFANDDPPIRAVVCYKSLRHVEASNNAELTFRETIAGDYLFLKARSGGSLSLKADVTTLEVTATQGGTLELQGKSRLFEAKANTGGLVKAFGLHASDCLVTANTGGKVQVTVSNKLEAKAGTGGEIEYAGNPGSVAITESLGGEVNKR